MNLKGLSLTFTSAILTSAAAVLTNHVVQGVNPLVVVFYSFSFMVIFINLFGLNKLSNLTEIYTKYYKFIILLNLSAIFEWVLGILALYYLSGSLVNAISFGVLPMATMLILYKRYMRAKLLVIIRDLSLGIIVIFLLIKISLNQRVPVSNEHLLVGVVLCILSGIFSAYTIVLLNKFASTKVKAFDIMKVRFWGVILVSGITALIQNSTFIVAPSNLIKLFILSISLLILPTYLLQKGIESVRPIIISAIGATIPMITYLIESSLALHFNYSNLILFLSLSMVLIVYSLIGS